MKMLNHTFLLRLTVSIILLMHSVVGMFNNGINDFGNLYLNQIGFAPFGVLIAWLVKLSHVVTAAAFMTERFVRQLGSITIIILILGIVMVHAPNGWFVVGGGRNGVEFNILLIASILTIMYPNGFRTK